MDEAIDRQSVVLALVVAGSGRDMSTNLYEGLAGASVVGSVIEAYVVVARDGFHVELWSSEGADPVGVELFADLGLAAECAVHRCLVDNLEDHEGYRLV